MSQCNQLLCKVIESPKNFAANGDHNIQSIKILVGRNGWLIGDTKRSYHPAAGNQYILSCHYGLLHILRTHSDPCLTTCTILLLVGIPINILTAYLYFPLVYTKRGIFCDWASQSQTCWFCFSTYSSSTQIISSPRRPRRYLIW